MKLYLRFVIVSLFILFHVSWPCSATAKELVSPQQIQSMTHGDISNLKTFEIMPDKIKGTKEYGIYADYSAYARDALIKSGLKEFKYNKDSNAIPDQIIYLHFGMKKGSFSPEIRETNCYNDNSGSFSCASSGGNERSKYTFSVEFTAYDITEWKSGNLDGPIAWRSQTFLIIVSPGRSPDHIFKTMMKNISHYLHADTNGFAEIKRPF